MVYYFVFSGDESFDGPYKREAIATDTQQCSEIGKDILNVNGSAVDAAIAAMFCLGVVSMHSSGIGGGGVMLLYNQTLKKATVIDFREIAPATCPLGCIQGQGGRSQERSKLLSMHDFVVNLSLTIFHRSGSE